MNGSNFLGLKSCLGTEIKTKQAMSSKFHDTISVRKSSCRSYQIPGLSRSHLNHANLSPGPNPLTTISQNAWKQECRAFKYTPTRALNVHTTIATILSNCCQSCLRSFLFTDSFIKIWMDTLEHESFEDSSSDFENSNSVPAPFLGSLQTTTKLVSWN